MTIINLKNINRTLEHFDKFQSAYNRLNAAEKAKVDVIVKFRVVGSELGSTNNQKEKAKE